MRTVLIVDDIPRNRYFLARILSDNGYRVIEASGSQEAIDKAHLENPDLLISDIIMPGMNGIDVVRDFRADPGLRHIPVAFYSARFTVQEAENMARACGVDNVIARQSDPKKILKVVESFFNSDNNSPPEIYRIQSNWSEIDAILSRYTALSYELRTTKKQLPAIIELCHRLLSERDPHTVLKRFCQAFREILHAQFAVVAVPVEMNYSHLQCYSCTASGESNYAEGSIVYGWIYAINRVGGRGEFTVEDEHMAVTIAAKLAVLLENIRLFHNIKSFISDWEHDAEFEGGLSEITGATGRGAQAAEKEPAIPQVLHEAERRHDEIRRMELNEARASVELSRQAIDGKLELLHAPSDHSESSSILKNAFIGNISHELKTPLTGILGMNELLLHTELDANQRDMAQHVHESAIALLGVVDNLLDISRIQNGLIELKHTELNLKQMVERVVSLLTPSAAAKELSITTSVDDQLSGILYGDSTCLNQVLLHMIGNAIKFTQEGLVSVSARVIQSGEDVLEVRFEITDTGIGISPEEKALLFQPFTQADDSLTRHYGGTGLGLAICKKLVELMGGKIGVDSRKGQGATFWFEVVLLQGMSGSML